MRICPFACVSYSSSLRFAFCISIFFSLLHFSHEMNEPKKKKKHKTLTQKMYNEKHVFFMPSIFLKNYYHGAVFYTTTSSSETPHTNAVRYTDNADTKCFCCWLFYSTFYRNHSTHTHTHTKASIWTEKSNTTTSSSNNNNTLVIATLQGKILFCVLTIANACVFRTLGEENNFQEFLSECVWNIKTCYKFAVLVLRHNKKEAFSVWFLFSSSGYELELKHANAVCCYISGREKAMWSNRVMFLT